MAYRFVPFPMILDDLEGHLPIAELNQMQFQKCVRHFARLRHAVPRR